MLHTTPSEATPRPYVGGQAIIEGVFMRAPRALAMAVRLPSGEITTQAQPYTPFFARHKLFKLPGIRGAFVMVDALVVGMKALSWSALAWPPADVAASGSRSAASRRRTRRPMSGLRGRPQ